MARNYRLKYWNYKGRGIYMITLNVEGRKPLLGTLQGGMDNVWVEYSPLGKIVSERIEQTFEPYSQIQICAKRLMPDHLHFIVWVKGEIQVTLGQIIRDLKIGCTHAWWEMKPLINERQIDATTQNERRDIESREAKKSGHMDATGTNASSLFEAGFHDRVLLHAGQLRSLIDYVHDNPRRAAIKRANPELFKLRQAVDVAGFECTILGNRFLLDDPMKEMLQCSRSLTQDDIDRKKQECLRLADRGVVYVSAGISEGEKQICRALREAGFPLIVLLNDGFPPADSPHAMYYKPQGVYFETCAKGKLLLIEPGSALFEDKEIETEVYRKDPRCTPKSMRYRFLALNAIIRRICG